MLAGKFFALGRPAGNKATAERSERARRARRVRNTEEGLLVGHMDGSLHRADALRFAVEPGPFAWYWIPTETPITPHYGSNEEKLRPRYQRPALRSPGDFQVRGQRSHHSHLRHRRGRPIQA